MQVTALRPLRKGQILSKSGRTKARVSMAVPTSVLEAYRQSETAVTALGRYVIATLTPWCDEKGYVFIKRTKTVASVAEKLESGRFSRWSQIEISSRVASLSLLPRMRMLFGSFSIPLSRK